MNTSILIIAHNEEAYIQGCIKSLLTQSKKADEIILIAHNCSDSTVERAGKFRDIKIFDLQTESTGPTIARKYGFKKVNGDIIACIDGDTTAGTDWLENMIKPFQHDSIVAASGKPHLLENSAGELTSFFFFLMGLPIVREFMPFYFWGMNFAVRKSAYDQVGGFEQVQEIQKTLSIHYDAEDCILSFLLRRIGKIS